MVKKVIDPVRRLKGIRRLLFDKPIKKFIVLILVYIFLNYVVGYFPQELRVRTIINIIGIIISIYFIVVIIYLIRSWINHLINPDSILKLIAAYALFILGILLLFSTLFNLIETAKLGYLTYGTCSDKFNSSIIASDPQISRTFFYFSAVSFFSVGYGDICPMGLAKLLAIFTAFVGHLVSVILVALILNNYLRKRENN